MELTQPGLRVVAPRRRIVDPVSATPPAARPESGRAAPGRAAAPQNATKEPALVLRCRPAFYPITRGGTLTVVAVQVDGPVEPAVVDGALLLDLDLDLIATSSGEVVRRGTRTVRGRLRPEAKEGLTRGILLRDAIVLPPGVLDLRVDLRLNGLGRSGSWSGSIHVPSLSYASFGLTDLTLMNPRPEAQLPVLFDVFASKEPVHGTTPPATCPDPLGDPKGRPVAVVDGAVDASVPLLVQVGVTGPPPAKPGAESPLVLDWEILPEGETRFLAPPVRYRRLEMSPSKDYFDVVAELDLRKIPAGRHTLRIRAENRDTGQVEFRIAPLRVAAAAQ